MRFIPKLETLLLLLTIFILNSVAQNCSKGCLSCGSDNKCRICDITEFYILKDGKCNQITTLDHCDLINENGDCIRCKENYYIDSTTMKCIAVDASSTIANCSLYNSSKSCVLCKPGYYIDNSICLGNGTSLANCEIQLDQSICLTCKGGYMLKPDKSGCIQMPYATENCTNYSYVNCKGCTSNYILDSNKYLRDLEILINSNSDVSSITNSIKYEKSNNINQGFKSICQPITVLNCLETLNYNKCKRCKEGYYLTDQLICKENPVPNISKCITYNSIDKCKTCDAGYYVDLNSKCTPVISIVGCDVYNTSANKTICIKCTDQYYLASSLTCSLRTRLEVENCFQYKINRDECELCDDSYQVTNDGARCLPKITNCNIYNVSVNSTSQHTCKKCDNGYYMTSDTECKKGTVPNCKVYELSTNSCTECEEKYFLENSTSCLPHDDISGCELYDQSEKNKCLMCNNISMAFISKNRCLTASTIPGCLNYSSESTCDKCGEGYYLSGNICVEIPNTMNCLEATSASVCTLCKPNYLLHENNCETVPSYIINQCENANNTDGLQTLETIKCFSCNGSYIQWNFENEFVCIENAWIEVFTNNTLSNCAQYYVDGDGVKCVRCNSGYYLNNSSCSTSCNSNPIITNELTYDDGEDDYLITTGRYCESDSFDTKIDNCEVYAFPNNIEAGTINGNPICIRCKSNYGKVVDPTSSNSTGMEDNTLLENYTWQFTAPVAFLPKVNKCIDISSTSSFTMRLASGSNKYIVGCDYYKEITTDSIYACIKCKNGQSGLLANTTNGDFISSCSTISCKSDFIPGLQAQLNSYISCYSCANTNSIPFLFIKGGSTYSTINGYKSYDLTNVSNDWDSVTNGGYSIGCYAKDGSEFTSITSFNLPSNCAIGAFNVESNTTSAANANATSLSTATNLTVFCLACEPGYKRTFGTLSTGTTIPYMVYQCTKISNCSQKSWFNYCTQCNNNYAFLYDEDTGIDYTECVSYSSNPNCLATTAAITGTCVICKKGYTLNYDGFCEMLEVPYCQANNFNSLPKFKRVDFGTIFYQTPLGAGCHNCNNGYSPINLYYNKQTCISSTYLVTLNSLETTKYTKYCNNYYLDEGEIKCNKCLTGYVLAGNYKECLSISQLSNCVLAVSNTECFKCLSGYISINYKCQKTTISNCAIFDLNPSQTQENCIQCNQGYFLKDNACQEGKVKNCMIYNNDSSCNQCNEGYILVNTPNNDYCYEIPVDINCKTFNSDLFNVHELECDECSIEKPFYIADIDSLSKYKCLNINLINGCVEYYNDGNLNTSTLMCKKCNDAFYLSNGECITRKYIDANCEQFNLYEDACYLCKSDFYLDKGSCNPNPKGIMDCIAYVSESICYKCASDYYLFNNTCTLVASSSKILNCLYYSNSTTCSECKSGYALFRNSCIQTTAKNCLTVKNATECASCSSDKGLKTENNVTSCVSNPDSNCKTFIQVYPFRCITCKSGYYPDSQGVCAKTTNSISGCEIYDGPSSCSKCSKGYALTTNHECTNSSEYKSHISSICEYSIIESDPICTQCKKGYIFDSNGNCIQACSSGCQYCNPDDTTKCFVCASGSYMQVEGSCIAVSGMDDENKFSYNFEITAILLLIVYLLY